MHFAFSDQQHEFRHAVHQVVVKECTTDHLRAAYDEPTTHSPRWATLASMGIVGITVPEEHGGLGLGLVDLVPLIEEAGRVALPEPLIETTALAAPLLAELGGLVELDHPELDHPELDHEGGATGAATSVAVALTGPLLDRIAAGEVTGAVGVVGPDGPPVAAADGADFLVLFTSAEQGGDPAHEVHLVDSSMVTLRTVSSLDPTRRLAVPHWTPTPDTLLAGGTMAREAIRRTGDRAAVATAAELLGLTETMISMTAEYAKERQQFGRPIGGFQAVKHLLAGAQVRLEFARPVVYAAAWALDEGEPTQSRSASTAKAYASEAALEAARVALQVHGAIGYTWECDLHLFLKRAWALAEAWGSAAEHRQRVLASLVARS